MPNRNVLTTVALGSLAVITAILVVVALLQGRGAPSSQGQTATPAGAASSSVGEPTPSTSTSSTATSSSPSPSNSPSATTATTTTSDGNGTGDIRALWSAEEPVTVLVLGDESGAAASGWVRKWADAVAESHPVAYHQWTGAGFSEAKQLGEATGEPVTIRNASLDGATADALAEQADELTDEAPDLVLVNLGMNEEPEKLADRMSALREAIGPDTLWAVVLQNAHKQGDLQRQVKTVTAMHKWADTAKLPVIDVYGVFAHDSAPLATLLDDGGRIPNTAGAKLWAFTVELTIGP